MAVLAVAVDMVAVLAVAVLDAARRSTTEGRTVEMPATVTA